MHCRSVAPLAIFLEFKLLCLFFLVDGCGVVAAFALGACKSDYICHVTLFPFVMMYEIIEYFSTLTYSTRLKSGDSGIFKLA